MRSDKRRRNRACYCIELLLALLLGIPVLTQAERLPIKTYTIADGLARDYINRIIQDSKGFIWFCTTEGLSRFDGYTFTNYEKEQGLPVRHVNDFLESRSGVYWIATGEGLCMFNPDPLSQQKAGGAREPQQRFVVYRPDKEPFDVSAIHEDRAGTIWCGTSRGLYRFDKVNDRWTFSFVDIVRPDPIAGNLSVIAILEDRQGSLWIGTLSELYRRWPDGSVEVFSAKEGMSVQKNENAMLEDRDGRIWIGAGIGLYLLVPDPKPGRPVVERVYTSKDGLPEDTVFSIFQSSDGRMWVGTTGGLGEFLPAGNKDGGRFQSYTLANGLADQTIRSLAEDRNGNLWMGTESGGAMKMAANGFTTYLEADGLGGNRIASIFENRAGDLFVMSSSTFINRFEGKRFTSVHLALPAGISTRSWGWYQFMFQDREGEWWMPTGEGLVRYPKSDRIEQLVGARPRAIYTTRNGLKGDFVFRLFEDSRGDIWVSTFGTPRLPQSITRWERATGTFHHVMPIDISFGDTVTAYCEDARGDLWMGFYMGGLSRYRAGQYTFFTQADGLPDGFIRGIYLDSAGRLWIATGEGGVARIDNPHEDRPRFITYTTADGLSSNHITCITEDQWGRIYIGTGRGVNRLDPKTGHIKQYTTADGLANGFVNVSFRDRTGALWFGTLQGLSRLVPQPERSVPPPPILISALRIGGVPYPVSELGSAELGLPELSANQNHIQIDFLGLDLAVGESLRYQYKLEGADQEWSAPSDNRTVNYASLRSGTYRFLVRAVTTDSDVSPSPATVSFTILPPLWQRWWFISFALLIAGTSVYSIYRYRVARLIELERVRTRIATDLHDDIGSSLSQVSVLSEVIRQRISPDPAVAEPLSMIARLSRDLVDSMSDIVWAINPQRDNLSDLSHRMRRFASDIFTARDIEFSFRSPDQQHDIKMGADLRREVFLVFKESVNNIARHSKCSEAHIDFHIEDGWLELMMSDNGKGFDPKEVRDGNGLTSMRQRAERLGGRLEIDSNDRGTTIRLKAPVGRRRAKSRLSMNGQN